VNGLRKYYGKHRGVEDLSFEIHPGEIYGLIGPNGAGKTTAIRSVLGLLKRDAGDVLIADRKIPSQIEEVKPAVGYLPGEVNYYGDMKVRDLLSFNRRFYGSVDTRYEAELIEYLDIDIQKKFKELSQGNRKKVGILQSIVHKPDYLILDEPTNGLDPLLQEKLYQLLSQEKARGVSILFSSHVLSEVERLCQRVGVIKQGRLIREFTIDSLKEFATKRVTIVGLRNAEALDRFEVVEEGTDRLTFSVRPSELQEFLKDLCKASFEDMEIKNPSLTEAFMEYYSGSEQS
jgi:ABC-2 type transport system ATP-binding protein